MSERDIHKGELPEWAGKVIGITTIGHDLVIACEGGVFRQATDGFELVVCTSNAEKERRGPDAGGKD